MAKKIIVIGASSLIVIVVVIMVISNTRDCNGVGERDSDIYRLLTDLSLLKAAPYHPYHLKYHSLVSEGFGWIYAPYIRILSF